MLFDDHNHPVNPREVDLKDKRYNWERCYKMVSIIHTNRSLDFFLYVGLKLLRGRAHESPVLYDLVADFIKGTGRGVMKTLILDRGFIDGPAIGKCKKDYGVDVVIPLRTNMDLYQDVLGLTRGRGFSWEPYENAQPGPGAPPIRPPAIEKREAARQRTLAARKGKAFAPKPGAERNVAPEAKASFVGRLKESYSWETCPVPLNAIINREVDRDGSEEFWVLVTTHLRKPSAEVRKLYGLRPAIEERHRQVKCFWDLTDFRSRSFTLILNQVLFIALTYTLLQAHLYLRKRADLNRLTRRRMLQMLTPTVAVIIVYYQRRFARLSIPEYSEILLRVTGKAKKKLLNRMKRMRLGLEQDLLHPRPT